eukprot:5626524-Amphidinium_carterae.1
MLQGPTLNIGSLQEWMSKTNHQHCDNFVAQDCLVYSHGTCFCGGKCSLHVAALPVVNHRTHSDRANAMIEQVRDIELETEQLLAEAVPMLWLVLGRANVAVKASRTQI